MNVKLVGKTQKGKQRVKQWGEVWMVKEVRDGHALIEVKDTDTWRWIWLPPKEDEHFLVSVIE